MKWCYTSSIQYRLALLQTLIPSVLTDLKQPWIQTYTYTNRGWQQRSWLRSDTIQKGLATVSHLALLTTTTTAQVDIALQRHSPVNTKCVRRQWEVQLSVAFLLLDIFHSCHWVQLVRSPDSSIRVSWSARGTGRPPCAPHWDWGSSAASTAGGQRVLQAGIFTSWLIGCEWVWCSGNTSRTL